MRVESFEGHFLRGQRQGTSKGYIRRASNPTLIVSLTLEKALFSGTLQYRGETGRVTTLLPDTIRRAGKRRPTLPTPPAVFAAFLPREYRVCIPSIWRFSRILASLNSHECGNQRIGNSTWRNVLM